MSLSAYPPGSEVTYEDYLRRRAEPDMVYPVGYRALAGPARAAERGRNGVRARQGRRLRDRIAGGGPRIYDDLAGGDVEQRRGGDQGNGLDTYLAQLIDPVAEVSVALPEVTTTAGPAAGHQGGTAALRRRPAPLWAPPMTRTSTCRSRCAAGCCSATPGNGSLVFRGYYDGTSAEYIKGDPLLLLNVMSESDMYRLQDLCATTTPRVPDASTPPLRSCTGRL